MKRRSNYTTLYFPLKPLDCWRSEGQCTKNTLKVECDIKEVLFLELLFVEHIYSPEAFFPYNLHSYIPNACPLPSFSCKAWCKLHYFPLAETRKQRCLVDGMDVYIYTLYGARFQPTVVTHKAKKGPISWPHSGSKGKTMAPTGLCNWARGHLTIINISF